MKFTSTGIADLWLIEPRVFEDSRGYFFESFNEQSFKNHTGITIDFIQDNESRSTKGVLRGMHFQKREHAQAKLVRVIEGEVQDVAVDLREGSPTFGEHFSVNISAENKKQLFIPRGFAHGFLVLSETAVFSYKCDNYYNKESEGGLLYSCPNLGIDWQLKDTQLLLSDKDIILPCFEK
jgi:dTDP-4-dehydrorhamnose 3,5-epimerase